MKVWNTKIIERISLKSIQKSPLLFGVFPRTLNTCSLKSSKQVFYDFNKIEKNYLAKSKSHGNIRTFHPFLWL